MTQFLHIRDLNPNLHGSAEVYVFFASAMIITCPLAKLISSLLVSAVTEARCWKLLWGQTKRFLRLDTPIDIKPPTWCSNRAVWIWKDCGVLRISKY